MSERHNIYSHGLVRAMELRNKKKQLDGLPESILIRAPKSEGTNRHRHGWTDKVICEGASSLKLIGYSQGWRGGRLRIL